MFNVALLVAACLSAPALVSAAAPRAHDASVASFVSVGLIKSGGSYYVAPPPQQAATVSTTSSFLFLEPVGNNNVAASVRRAAKPSNTDDNRVLCKTNTDCTSIDKNSICAENSNCRCKDGFLWDNPKQQCVKATKALCSSTCKEADPHFVCLDVDKNLCACDVGYLLNATRDGCRKATKAQCDAECVDEFGKGWVCLPDDWQTCHDSTADTKQ